MSGKSELQIFNSIPPQVVVEQVFCDINPITGTDDNTIEFVINGSQNEYIDLNDTLLYLKLNVINSDGSKLDACSSLAPTNYMMNALFSDVVLSMNNVIVEGGNPHYPSKATIESIFNFSEDSKRLQLLPMGYSDEVDERRKWVKESKYFELAGALRLDFFNQPKYIIPGVDIRVLLKRSKDEFALIANALGDVAKNPQVDIKKATLYVRRVKVAQTVQLGHQIGLLKRNAIYPYTRSETISTSISKGSLSFTKDNLFGQSLLPKFVVVGTVNGSAYNGNNLHDAFKFEGSVIGFVS